MKTNRRGRAAVCFLGACLAVGAVRAAPFIRGDANGDGRVSVADAVKITFYLFSEERDGVELGCADAGDANDSGGCVDIADIAAIVSYLVGEYSLPAPYPEPGDDPTPDPTEPCSLDSGCESNERDPPLDDPQARIEMLDAIAPGGGDGKAYLVVAVTNSFPLAGLSFVVRFNSDVLASVPTHLTDIVETGNLEHSFAYLANPRELRVTSMAQYNHIADTLPPGQEIPILEIPVCLARGTLAGAYAMTLEAGELVAAKGARSILPSFSGATLVVEADVTVAVDCTQPDPPPPPPFNGAMELVGGTAPPGGFVDVGLRMEADALIQGYGFSVDFDEEVLEIQSAIPVWRKPDGTGYSFQVYEVDNRNATPGSGGVDEGFVLGVTVFDFVQTVGVPPSERTDMVKLRFQVRPETTANATELRFVDGSQGSGQPVRNTIAANGTIDYTLDTAESFVLINGFVGVFPDIITFVRGDSNGDEKVDISDPQATLSYLFLGKDQVACYDAADSNDDGRIDISDPVTTLEYLFQSGSAPPEPYPAAGPDPTEDSQGCLYAAR